MSEKTRATNSHSSEKDVAKHALDELFSLTSQYKTSEAYRDLLQFVVRFRSYSPFNAMLTHLQMPGAVFVAPPHRWLRDYGRRIKPGARPVIILQPMGPVMFVFDVSDTEPTEDAPKLPPEVEKPFEVTEGKIGRGLEFVIDNAKRDGIRTTESNAGSQSAGSIRPLAMGVRDSQKFLVRTGEKRNPVFIDVPVKYDLVINSKLSREAQYATIVHELAHLYCGHLGTPNEKWWPDRHSLSRDVMEFEAESVTYMACLRSDISNPSEKYLASHVKDGEQIPPISLECVMKSVGLIESMSKQRMKPREPLKQEGEVQQALLSF